MKNEPSNWTARPFGIGNDVLCGKLGRLKQGRSFTLIEMILVVVIFAILIAIVLPSLVESRKRAKYVRWFAYNQTWNRDADCVINYNFQDGKKDVFQKVALGTDMQVVSSIKNGALSCDWNNGINSFNGSDYDGIIGSPESSQTSAHLNLKKEKGGALTTGGRWGNFKQALDFSGAGNPKCYSNSPGASNANMVLQCSSYRTGMMPIRSDAIITSSGDIVAQTFNPVTNSLETSSDLSRVDLQRDAADFTALGSFTIVAWVNFGEKAPTASAPQCIFSKACGGLKGVADPGMAGCAGSQYDMFTDIQSSDKGAFDAECINQSIGFPQTDKIKFKDSEWKQVVLRYTYPSPAKTGVNDAVRSVDCFVNGMKMSGTGNSYSSGSISVEPNPIARSQAILAVGGFFWYGYPQAKNWEYTWPFCGKIDEFMVLKKALSDKEIEGEYTMGMD